MLHVKYVDNTKLQGQQVYYIQPQMPNKKKSIIKIKYININSFTPPLPHLAQWLAK